MESIENGQLGYSRLGRDTGQDQVKLQERPQDQSMPRSSHSLDTVTAQQIIPDKDGTTKVYIPVHPCLRASSAGLPYPRREVWSENEMDVDVQISYQQLEASGTTNFRKVCVRNEHDGGIDIVVCQDIRCSIAECNGLKYHCPLCEKSDNTQKFPYLIRNHVDSVHFKKAVRHNGYVMLFCRRSCTLLGLRGYRVMERGNYHCFACDNGFLTAVRLKNHIAKRHVVDDKFCNNSDVVLVRSWQPDPQPQTNNKMQSCLVPDQSALLSAKKLKPSNVIAQTDISSVIGQLPSPSTSTDDLDDISATDVSNDASEYSTDNVPFTDNLNDASKFSVGTKYSLAATSRSLSSSTSLSKNTSSVQGRVPCPVCGKTYHCRALKIHVQTVHSKRFEPITVAGYINANHFLYGICVDRRQGIFLIRKNFSGPSHPVHVAYSMSSVPAVARCSVMDCVYVTQTARVSGDAMYMCDHIKSVQFITRDPPFVPELSRSSLDYVVHTLHIIRPSRIDSCLQHQQKAVKENVPLVVPYPRELCSSSKYRHFSVFADARSKYWSFLNRVVVTFDTERSYWYCKCRLKSLCSHKLVAIWYMSEVDHCQLGMVPDDGDEEGESPSLQQDEESQSDEAGESYLSKQTFPPTPAAAQQLISYISKEKKIPPDLPKSLTINVDIYPTSYIPAETRCICSKKPTLSITKLITGHGKLLTMKGLTEGISSYFKHCPECLCVYQYQEYSQGVHNFDNFWFLSLGVCDYLRQQLKVHNAVGRAIEALQKMLKLESNLPVSVIRNAYFHFEALTDHHYEFMCVLCGFYPPLLVTDVDKKGIFELSALELEMPSDNESNPDIVDCGKFWESVDKGILYCAFHSCFPDNPFELKPSYKFWSPYIGPFSRKDQAYNSEHRKCHHEKDLEDFGCRRPTLDEVADLLEGGTAKVVKELCIKYGLSGAGSKRDNIIALKDIMKVPREFVKVFDKIWGGSGGWLGASCPHSVCYGLKWLLRQEGARDHIDLLLSLKHQPNFIVVDFANMVAAHGEKRQPGMFHPFKGRLAEPTAENIKDAEEERFQVDFPWYPNGFPSAGNEKGHPVTGSDEHYALFDAWHEKNSSNPEDLLRSTRFVKQLGGLVSTEVQEHMNNEMNRNNYFMTSLTPHNSLFLMRLIVHFHNQERNEELISKIRRGLDGSPYLSELGELRVNLHSQLPSSIDDWMMNSLVNNFRQKSTMIEKLAAQSPGFDSSISSTLSLASRKTLEQTTPSSENNTQVFSTQELGLSRSCDAYLSTSSSSTTASVTRTSHTIQLITTSTSSSSTTGSVTRTLQTGSFTHIKQLITASSASSVAVLGKRKSTDVNPSVSSPVVGSKSGTRPMFRTREVNPTPVVSSSQKPSSSTPTVRKSTKLQSGSHQPSSSTGLLSASQPPRRPPSKLSFLKLDKKYLEWAAQPPPPRPLPKSSTGPITITNLPNVPPSKINDRITAWLFPVEFSQSKLGGRNGSNACSLIAVCFIRAFLNQKSNFNINFNDYLSPIIKAFLLSGILQGNHQSDVHTFESEYPTTQEALDSIPCASKLALKSSFPVKFKDIHVPSTVGYQIQTLVGNHRRQAAMLVMNSKSSSFLFEDNAIIFIDTHLHTVDEKQVGTIVIASQSDVENLIPLVKSIIKAQDSDCGNLEIVERCSE